MQQEFTKFLAIVAIVTVIICFVLALLGTIGAVKITDGCFLRYNFDDTGTPVDQISKTIILKANGNYNAITVPGPDGKPMIKPDPSKYGRWVNSNLVVTPGQTVAYQIKGEVSLCMAYLPRNNLQNTNNLDKNGNKIPIPRIDDNDNSPISLYFDAKTDDWRNITQVFKNDKIIVSASPNHKDKIDSTGKSVSSSNVSFEDIFTKSAITADCSDGKKTYSPICGRYSIYKGQYVIGCDWNSSCYDCNPEKECYFGIGALGWCTGGKVPCWLSGCKQWECDRCGCWENKYGDMPEPYKSNNEFTQAWSTNWGELIRNFQPQCNDNGPRGCRQAGVKEKDRNYIVNGDYMSKRFMWFSADDVAGLLYRFDTNENPTNSKSRGATFNFAEISADQTQYNPEAPKDFEGESQGEAPDTNLSGYNIILNQTYSTGADIAYLQYRYHANDGAFAGNTGGYVLNIKHTKCRRTNGSVITDTYADRGKVFAAVVPFGQDPNITPPTYGAAMIPTNSDGDGSFQVSASDDKNGYVWMRIENDANDYKDSVGEYSVHIKSHNKVGTFAALILQPLLTFKNKVRDAGTKIFENMTCYKKGVTGTCTNFFNYVRALLMLYIAFQGAMFLLGMVRMNQYELIIKIIRVIIVAGLINEQTFSFFNNIVFPFVTNFCDVMILNIGGYGTFSSNNGGVINPLMFTDTLMSRMLFTQAFLGQMLALLSMGISGILYFILIFIAIIIVIITILRAIAVYLMAFCAIAVLIGIAPLFLTFMLFDSTRYLFDNWVRFTVRYMMEPLVLLAGIIVLNQLFTIYLDYAVGYSVCWKCALPIKIPFPSIPGFDSAFANVELFCLNWFGPWGLDQRSGMLGVNIQHIISLVIIAYCLYGYTDLSGKMVVKLVGGFGGPSATSMGGSMTSAFANKALKSVGLDKGSRKDIAKNAKQRLKNRVSAIDNYKKGLKNQRKESDARRGDGNDSDGSNAQNGE